MSWRSEGVVLLLAACVLGSSAVCEDGVHNVIAIDSYGNKSLPIQVRNVKMLVYDIDMNPSCYGDKVNVVLPGFFKLTSGEVHTSRDFDVVGSGEVSVSVSLDGDHICLEGASQMFLVPNNFCKFEMKTFVPVDICELLQKKGVHTLEELEEKRGFNRTLETPPSPSFLGISLLDVLKGNYRIKVSISSYGEKIVEFALPTHYVDLQMGLYEDTD